MSPTTFKVIVVGGGPVGLTAAHALDKAGIDFLLLERRPEVVIDAGSNLVLAPTGIRALASLGIEGAINSSSSPLGRIDRVDHNGHNIGHSEIFTQLAKNTGAAPRVISRHDLTKVLYETLTLEAQAKVLSDKTVSKIVPTQTGVTAICSDGSSYDSTTIIAADGAHSRVRGMMRDLAIESGSIQVNAEVPYLTTYRCLWIRFPGLPGLPVGLTCESHGRDLATQLFVGEQSGVIGVYERLAEPTRDRIHHTQDDQESLVEQWGHVKVTPKGHTLRDIYTSRKEAGLVSLEEGVVDHFNWNGRIVLTGDSAHKFTPSTGAGCNNGMVDIIVIVNELHAAVQNASGSIPSYFALSEAFETFQNIRKEAVVTECARSGQMTRMASWSNALLKFMDTQVLSLHFLQRMMIDLGRKDLAKTPVLDFVPCSSESHGRVQWVAPAPRVASSA